MTTESPTSAVTDISERFERLKPSLVRTETRVGPMAVYKNDNIVSHSILLFGEYSHAEVLMMAHFLDKDSVYLDIGTNVGYHALGIHSVVGCRVIGFEPHPNHFAVAAFNCNEHNIQIYNCAVAEQDGLITISDFDETEVKNYGEVQTDTNGIEVKAIKLDTLNLPKVDLMKIDVEGFEINVLEGATDTIDKCRPVIFYEALTLEDWGPCYDYLKAKKYKQYWFTCRVKPVAETYKQTEENPFGTTGVSNILAIPEEDDQVEFLIPVIEGEHYNVSLDRILNYKLIF